MKNIYEVLRNKELDLARLRTEVDALRFVAPCWPTKRALPTSWTNPTSHGRRSRETSGH
jgi:hypothetical protein